MIKRRRHVSFDRFLAAFVSPGVAPGTRQIPPLPPPLKSEGFAELLGGYGGCTVADGAYRLFDAAGVNHWTRVAGAAFPAHRGSILCFASDWLGRQFALDARRQAHGESEVLILDVGAGEAYQVPATFAAFHEVELVGDPETVLEVSLYRDWRSRGGAVPADSECAGYRVPLFLGGEAAVENLEVIDMAVYWDITAQVWAGTRQLPPGTTIRQVSIS